MFADGMSLFGNETPLFADGMSLFVDEMSLFDDEMPLLVQLSIMTEKHYYLTLPVWKITIHQRFYAIIEMVLMTLFRLIFTKKPEPMTQVLILY